MLEPINDNGGEKPPVMGGEPESGSAEAAKKVEPEPNRQYKRHRPAGPFAKKAAAAALVGVIGVGSGFGGAYLYGSTLGKSTSGTSLYQSVSTVATNTNTTGSALTTEQVVAKVADSVVQIATESVTTSSFLGKYVTSGAGSGVIVTANGYIVTNNHVIDGASKITVTLNDGTAHEATLVGADSTTDLAILKIDATGLSAAVLGDSDTLAVGQDVIVIGNPLGSLGGSVTSGIVSALSREITIDGNTMNLLQTNAAVNPGNSGGGLFDYNGNLVGIVNAKSTGEDVEGIGFAIPVNSAKNVIEDLISQGYVSGRVRLGVALVEVTNQQTAFQYGVSELGVYISSVTDNSDAAKAGLKSGDRIVSIDGTDIEDSATVVSIIQSHSVGDTLKITVSRNGQNRTVTVTLTESKG